MPVRSVRPKRDRAWCFESPAARPRVIGVGVSDTPRPTHGGVGRSIAPAFNNLTPLSGNPSRPVAHRDTTTRRRPRHPPDRSAGAWRTAWNDGSPVVKRRASCCRRTRAVRRGSCFFPGSVKCPPRRRRGPDPVAGSLPAGRGFRSADRAPGRPCARWRSRARARSRVSHIPPARSRPRGQTLPRPCPSVPRSRAGSAARAPARLLAVPVKGAGGPG